MKTILKSTCFLLLFTANFLIGQESILTRDIGLWMGVGVEHEINKKWDFSAKQELRTFDNAIKIRRSITDFGLDYKINKEFKLLGGLRYAYKREKNFTFSHNLRYNIDLKYEKQIASHLDLQYRFRFQSNYERPFTGLKDFKQRNKTRNRLKIEYERKNSEYYFSGEIFRVYANYRKPRFDKLRLMIGDKIDSKWGGIDIGLGYEIDLDVELPLSFFFLKMAYTITSSND